MSNARIFVNNVDVDKLPERVQTAIMTEFSRLPIKSKLIVYSKLVHGHLFRVTSNDFFNINKQTPNTVFREFMNAVRSHFEGDKNANKKRKKTSI